MHADVLTLRVRGKETSYHRVNCQRHQGSVSLTVNGVFATRTRVHVAVALASAFLLFKELTYVREIRRESPGFSKVPGFFSRFDRLEAESAAIEVCGSHFERLEK